MSEGLGASGARGTDIASACDHAGGSCFCAQCGSVLKRVNRAGNPADPWCISCAPDSSGPLSIPGIAGQTAWGIACDICGKGHDPAVHAPSTDALRAGASPAPPIPEPSTTPVDDDLPVDGQPWDGTPRWDVHAYHYTPNDYGPPYYHPDNALFSDDAERADDAARKRRRASLVAERCGPVRPLP
jgi:hypothetical protein